MIDEDRLNHTLAVARKMIEIGRIYRLNDNELQDLFLLGLNHDIGYEFGDNSNHAKIGGELLKRNNYKYWKEIYYHGKITNKYNSKYLTILNMADMQIDKYGNDVGYVKRLEDIKVRYGENSEVYNNTKILIQKLKNISTI